VLGYPFLCQVVSGWRYYVAESLSVCVSIFKLLEKLTDG
jgi:hypothetical protein